MTRGELPAAGWYARIKPLHVLFGTLSFVASIVVGFGTVIWKMSDYASTTQTRLSALERTDSVQSRRIDDREAQAQARWEHVRTMSERLARIEEQAKSLHEQGVAVLDAVKELRSEAIARRADAIRDHVGK